jgi:hypothetical protein
VAGSSTCLLEHNSSIGLCLLFISRIKRVGVCWFAVRI